MVVVAQLVRASVCGTECRGFESHLPPLRVDSFESTLFLCLAFSISQVFYLCILIHYATRPTK